MKHEAMSKAAVRQVCVSCNLVIHDLAVSALASCQNAAGIQVWSLLNAASLLAKLESFHCYC